MMEISIIHHHYLDKKKKKYRLSAKTWRWFVQMQLHMQTISAQPCKHRLNLHTVVKLKVGAAGVSATYSNNKKANP